MLKSDRINQAQVFTALILTGIFSVGSGITLSKSATAEPANPSKEIHLKTPPNSVYNVSPIKQAKNQQPTKTVNPVRIPPSDLPPPLDEGVVFRQITTGGIGGFLYETVLLKDGRLIRTSIRPSEPEPTVRHVFPQQVRRFKQLLTRNRRVFNNLSYPASVGSADFFTYTITSQDGTVQYTDTSANLPTNLEEVITAWNQLLANSQ